MTAEQLAAALGCPLERAQRWAAVLTPAMAEFEIDTPARVCAFLAQIGHESGRLQYVREVWGPTGPQARYEGRLDLGNAEPGDGFKYRGRGLIQITGRTNYRAVAAALGIDCEAQPELLEKPAHAARSAAWWWRMHGLNQIADQDTEAAFERITKRINGGLNGQADRLALWRRIKETMA